MRLQPPIEANVIQNRQVLEHDGVGTEALEGRRVLGVPRPGIMEHPVWRRSYDYRSHLRLCY